MLCVCSTSLEQVPQVCKVGRSVLNTQGHLRGRALALKLSDPVRFDRRASSEPRRGLDGGASEAAKDIENRLAKLSPAEEV